jgi:N-acetyl-anhydromuramyl-L-alanine amidase AmpD
MRAVKYIVVHHTATRADISPATIRMCHLKRGFSDVGYHYLITPDGRVHAGRDESRIGAHVKGYNAESIGVALIGNFEKYPPSPQQWDSLLTLLAQLTARYNARVAWHSQLGRTACPGRYLRDKLERAFGDKPNAEYR